MSGIALFLWEPEIDGRKKYIIEKLRPVFEARGMKTLVQDLSRPSAFEELGEKNDRLMAVPLTEKRFVFSMDADGFGLVLTMDGLWVDNVPYNVFTYLTMHPSFYGDRLSEANSWYISVLNPSYDGVTYLEEHCPQLEGMEQMMFPCFLGDYAELSISEREYDVFLLADAGEKTIKFAADLAGRGIRVLVSGKGFAESREYARSRGWKDYSEKLRDMGRSRIVFFFHESGHEEDIDVVSAMANGAVAVTEKTDSFSRLYQEGEEILYHVQNDLAEMVLSVLSLLQQPDRLSAISERGKIAARRWGSLSDFADRILERCK